jgi:hypothetical protein
MSTIERAFALARTGKYANLAQLQRQLIEDGCRAVKPLLAPRSISSYLEAICAASSKGTPVKTAGKVAAEQRGSDPHADANTAGSSKAEG